MAQEIFTKERKISALSRLFIQTWLLTLYHFPLIITRSSYPSTKRQPFLLHLPFCSLPIYAIQPIYSTLHAADILAKQLVIGLHVVIAAEQRIRWSLTVVSDVTVRFDKSRHPWSLCVRYQVRWWWEQLTLLVSFTSALCHSKNQHADFVFGLWKISVNSSWPGQSCWENRWMTDPSDCMIAEEDCSH